MAKGAMRHEDWARFLVSMSRALQLCQLYEPSHPFLADPIASIAGQFKSLHEGQGPTTMQGVESAFFVNGTRLRVDGSAFARNAQFLEALARRGVSGFRFQIALSEADWTSFLFALAAYDRHSTSAFEDLKARLKERGLTIVEPLPIQTGQVAARYSEVKVERRVFAVRAIAKTAALLKLYMEHVEDPRRQAFYHKRMQRAVQDVISACIEDGWKYVGFVNNRAGQDAICDHGVNVALISIAVGTRLGLRRARLAELGMAALLHDLGKVLHPAKPLTRVHRFSPEEREQLKQSPTFGVRALLKEGPMNEALLKRILVLCEHAAPMHDKAHPFSRLIAVAERFDALTNARPYRKAQLPDVAVAQLLGLKDLDADCVQAFASTVGLYPPGTVVELESGRIAVSFHPSPDATKYRNPIVRIAREADGEEAKGFPVEDLSSGKDRIRRSLDPARTVVDVPRVLAEAT